MTYKLNIKEARKIKGVTQKELSEKLGITQQNISDYERGVQVPNLDRLVQIAQALNLSLDELVIFDKVHEEYSGELVRVLFENSENKQSF